MTEARSVQDASTMLTPENNTPTNVCVWVCVGGWVGYLELCTWMCVCYPCMCGGGGGKGYR